MDIRENISLLMDGEKVTHKDIESIVNDKKAMRDWTNNHLVGDLLRGDVKGSINTSFMDKFNSAFEAEPIHMVHRKKKSSIFQNSFLRFIGQSAIAASVAALSVIGVNYYSSNGNVSADQVLATTPYGGMASPVRAKIQTTSNSIQVAPQEKNMQDKSMPIDSNKISNQELAQIEALLQDHEFQSRIQRIDR